jgi:hypothetical protein
MNQQIVALKAEFDSKCAALQTQIESARKLSTEDIAELARQLRRENDDMKTQLTLSIQSLSAKIEEAQSGIVELRSQMGERVTMAVVGALRSDFDSLKDTCALKADLQASIQNCAKKSELDSFKLISATKTDIDQLKADCAARSEFDSLKQSCAQKSDLEELNHTGVKRSSTSEETPLDLGTSYEEEEEFTEPIVLGRPDFRLVAEEEEEEEDLEELNPLVEEEEDLEELSLDFPNRIWPERPRSPPRNPPQCGAE